MNPEEFEQLRRMFALVASEQRSFVFTELLESSPMIPSELDRKRSELPPELISIEGFSDVINYSSIYDMCVWSLSSLGLADSIESEVQVGGKEGYKPSKAWYKNDNNRTFTDCVYFCLDNMTQLNEENRTDYSMHDILGGFGIGTAPISAARILHELDKSRLTFGQIGTKLKDENISYTFGGLLKIIRRLDSNGLIKNWLDKHSTGTNEKLYKIVKWDEDTRPDAKRISADSFFKVYYTMFKYYMKGQCLTKSKFQRFCPSYSLDTIDRVFKSLKRQGVLESGYPTQFISINITDMGKKVTQEIVNPIINSVTQKTGLNYLISDGSQYWGKALQRFSKG